jgi:hypothetical protein
MAVRPSTNWGKSCGLFLGTPMVFAEGGSNCKISSVSMALIFVSWTRRTLSRIGPYGSQIIFCHRTNRPTRGGVTAILLRKGIDNYATPVSGLQQLEATSKHLVLATRPMKIAAAYLSPTRQLFESDRTECMSGELTALMTGDVNAKHTDWNSRLITARGSLLCDQANRNICFIYELDFQTTAPST